MDLQAGTERPRRLRVAQHFTYRLQPKHDQRFIRKHNRIGIRRIDDFTGIRCSTAQRAEGKPLMPGAHPRRTGAQRFRGRDLLDVRHRGN